MTTEQEFFEKQFAVTGVRKGSAEYSDYEAGKRYLMAAGLEPRVHERAIGYLAKWVGL